MSEKKTPLPWFHIYVTDSAQSYGADEQHLEIRPRASRRLTGFDD